jgi:hypothetical protein
MFKTIFSAALLAAVVLPGSAPADVTQVIFHNKSTTCVWVTVYKSSMFSTQWDSTGRSLFVKAGDVQEFKITPSEEVKVDGIVMQHPDCTGNHIAHTWDVRKGLSRQSYINAALYQNGSKFNIWF